MKPVIFSSITGIIPYEEKYWHDDEFTISIHSLYSLSGGDCDYCIYATDFSTGLLWFMSNSKKKLVSYITEITKNDN